MDSSLEKLTLAPPFVVPPFAGLPPFALPLVPIPKLVIDLPVVACVENSASRYSRLRAKFKISTSSILFSSIQILQFQVVRFRWPIICRAIRPPPCADQQKAP